MAAEPEASPVAGAEADLFAEPPAEPAAGSVVAGPAVGDDRTEVRPPVPGDAGGYVVERRVSPAHRAVPRIGGVRPRAALAIALGMVLVALGIVISGHGTPAPAPIPTPAPAPAPSAAPPSSAPTSTAVPTVTVVPLSASAAPPPAGVRATEVRLPTLGVRSPLVDLDVGPDGALVPPAEPDVAGWYTRGAVPGQPGPTVIAGHVDSRTGPAVFYRLDTLTPGDRVEVARSDGPVFAYRVVAVERYPKDAFPTARVYGPTPGSELRLITCGGEFDRSVGHYRDDVVVSAIPIT